MRIPRRRLLAASLVAVLVAGCGTSGSDPVDEEPEGTDPGTEEPAPDPDDDDPGSSPGEPDGGFAVSIDGPVIELRQGDGEDVHRWTLEGSGTFHSFLVHPDGAPDTIDVVAVVLEGERPVLFHVYARPGGESGIAEFPEHLQPLHEVDTGPPVIAWTPDGRSLVWTEASGAAMVLRAVGWQDGPGTGRSADDNASFTLDAPGGAHVDGFEVISASTWTLILRGGGSDEPTEVPVERQADGALALPGAR